MPRVVGCDPGTSSLDLVLLDEGHPVEQARVVPDESGTERAALRDILGRWQPIDLVAGPSGYGLPLVLGGDLTERELAWMTLTRPGDSRREHALRGFKGYVRTLLETRLPSVFLPGGIHLPTIPAHRKANAIDLGTPDKLAVAALALRQHGDAGREGLAGSSFAVVEIGSAFSAVLVVERGRLVDASAGTRGPIGLESAGAWDGEVAYALSTLTKDDLYRGGLRWLGSIGPAALEESLVKAIAGLHAVTPFERIYLSGKGLESPGIAEIVRRATTRFGAATELAHLPGCWVKHAAQGAALLADGLAGGRHADLVESLALRDAAGTIWDHLRIRPDAPALPGWADDPSRPAAGADP
jgi:predicted butyrate kinase (DUF1464 family)